MSLHITHASVMLACALAASGCASTYGNLVSGSNLGAAEYRPAVLVNAGMEGRYNDVLAVCRQVATNRQITAAQEAQLKTITGVTAASLSGAAEGLQFGSLLKQAGVKTSINKDVGIGMMASGISALGTAFARGAESDAASTKGVLLNCLRVADARQELYKVLE